MDIVDMANQVGVAWKGQSFVLKISHLNFGKLSLRHKKATTDSLVKKYVHNQTNQIA